jgi:hypothetical protein
VATIPTVNNTKVAVRTEAKRTRNDIPEIVRVEEKMSKNDVIVKRIEGPQTQKRKVSVRQETKVEKA